MRKILLMLFTVFVTFLLYVFTKEFYNNDLIVLGLLWLFVLIFYYKHEYSLYAYLILLCFILLCRDGRYGQIADDDYLDKWIKMIFHNKIVFVNLLGNIVLFIPLGLLMREKGSYALLWGILFVVVIELLQIVLKKGIFDYIDIALNAVGLLLGIILWEIFIWAKRRKMKLKKC